MKLRFINKDVPDYQVWVKVENLNERFWKFFKAKSLDKRVVVNFSILKKKPSWIEFNGEKIDFQYNIVENNGALFNKEEYSHVVVFNLKNYIHQKAVKFDCTSKKHLIKILLQILVNDTQI